MQADMERTLAVGEAARAAPVEIADFAMSAEKITRQLRLIQDVMRETMRDGEDYGVIPGCGGKPSLLKPGAEKLSALFRLSPRYEMRRTDLPGGHREYEVVCTLIHGPTGAVLGQGLGACSTMEGKYRFRTGEVEWTGRPVPAAYWTNRDQRLIGGRGFAARKNPESGRWEIVRQGERIEHDNPADFYNTVLKMAKKRAHVDAVLTVTAASAVFTQDLEDAVEAAAPPPPSRPPEGQQAPETSARPPEPPPSEKLTKGDEALIQAVRTAVAGAEPTPEGLADAVRHLRRAIERCRPAVRGRIEAVMEERLAAAAVRGPETHEPETPETVGCPHDGEVVPAQRCETCTRREGCPAWPEEAA